MNGAHHRRHGDAHDVPLARSPVGLLEIAGRGRRCGSGNTVDGQPFVKVGRGEVDAIAVHDVSELQVHGDDLDPELASELRGQVRRAIGDDGDHDHASV